VGVPGFWHASSVHGLRSSQSAFDWQPHTFGPPTHSPPEQVSGPVQALPSLHAVPLGAEGFEHAPVSGLHVPARWHRSLGVHTTGFDPVQTPPWQASFLVQALPSLQGAVLLT
jgi:hypothetical protein